MGRADVITRPRMTAGAPAPAGLQFFATAV
jgi:hypothetical protein